MEKPTEKFGAHGRREANWISLVLGAFCTLAIFGEFDPVLDFATKSAFIVLITTGIAIVIVRRIIQAVDMYHALHDPLEVLLREDEEAKKNESSE